MKNCKYVTYIRMLFNGMQEATKLTGLCKNDSWHENNLKVILNPISHAHSHYPSSVFLAI